MTSPRINIVVAMATNGVIGRDGGLPWHISADLKRFKSITMGHPIVMGRKTFESIGRALPGRHNVIVTGQRNYANAALNADCVVVPSLADAISHCADATEIMVVGGASIYADALPICDRIFVTAVHADVEGDTIFPKLDPADWHETSREDVSGDRNTPFDYSFITLERVRR